MLRSGIYRKKFTGTGYATGVRDGVSFGHAFVSDNGGPLLDLGTLLSGTFSEGKGINDIGQVTGDADTTEGGSQTNHAFVYTPGGGMKDIGTLSGFGLSYGVAINEAGQVTGYLRGFRTEDAFLYTPGIGMRDIGAPAGFTESEGFAINAAGEVTGVAEEPVSPGSYSTIAHAFLYKNDQMIDLGAPTGGVSSQGLAINTFGDVVGSYAIPNVGGHAFLYRPDMGFTDLNTLLPTGSGWTLTFADGINDSGQIVGQGTNSDGEVHAFLLSPVQ